MRISDWSSDVCSSDLLPHPRNRAAASPRRPHPLWPRQRAARRRSRQEGEIPHPARFPDARRLVARAAGRDRPQAGRVLLYVHGYRENFNTTSKDAAQIARMTGFDGPIIEYSWPSQGKILSYVVDETNMYHDEIGRASCRERVCQYV